MNSIVLVTLIAGNIVSSATFSDLDSCKQAREQIVDQKDVSAYCIYKEVKPDRSKEMFKIFSDMIKELGELEQQ